MKFKLNINIVLLLVVFSFVPFVAFGEKVPETINQVSVSQAPEETNNFCSQLLDIKNKIKDQITKAEEKQSAYQDSRDIIIESKESEVDNKIAVSRTVTEAMRIDNWDKMISNAKTDEQKNAVISYQTTVQTAVDTRRTTEDEAINTYREGLTKVISAHTDIISSTVLAFKTTMSTAIANAENDCANFITDQIASDNFIKKIGEAKNILISTTQNDTTKLDVAELKDNKDNAIKNAEEIYKSSIDKAQDDLVITLQQ